MSQLMVRLFGKPVFVCGGDQPGGCNSSKVRELLCYLLLHRDRPHDRERLATLLWGETCTTDRARKYLRTTLWRLRTSLEGALPRTEGLLGIGKGWIELRSSGALWLDVDVFENAYQETAGVSDSDLSCSQVDRLRGAVALYTDMLLSTWSQDWCVGPRRRLHRNHLLMLGKLSGFHETMGEFELALGNAERILVFEQAHEGAHVRIMRLLDRMGDRTSAIRQYRWCAELLREELDAEPSAETVRLFEEIRGRRSGIGISGAGISGSAFGSRVDAPKAAL